MLRTKPMVLLTGVFLALGLSRSAFALYRLVSPPRAIVEDETAATIGRTLSGVVAVGSGDEVLDLGTLHESLLFVYDADCVPCKLNMSNWIDLMALSRDYRSGVLAIALGSSDRQRRFWRSFDNRIPVMSLDTTSMVLAGFRGTPTTAYVLDGTVVAETVGLLNEQESEKFRDAIKRGSAGRLQR